MKLEPADDGPQGVADGEAEAPTGKAPSPSATSPNSPPNSSPNSPRKLHRHSRSHSPSTKKARHSPSTSIKSDQEETVGGDIMVKMEPGKAPKLARATTKKVVSRPAPLFLDHPDATTEAVASFDLIPDCSYGNKSMGYAENAYECECPSEWNAESKRNEACGEDSDCINRATKMECPRDCCCGAKCRNQRFTRKQYANVTVIKTEKKGYGLRANSDLRTNDFIFEYIGEVIGEGQFRRRMRQYDQEGIKHFYFMSLSKGEFVDATKKGNLGRFCNHSCNPNCYVDKWVVGDKLRMGIFAERNIKAGEELVFNYNVDRYGADPQPCYCDEPNCTGFIGGKTQTERATKLSNTTIEALGIDDSDGWDTAVAKKPRKKKASEDDEEYVNNVQPKSLEENGVTKVMATLMQCKEKWIAVKLLSRIQRADDERVMNRVVRMHGYQILKTTLTTFMDDANIVLQALDILDKMPRQTRNKIQNSNVEEIVRKLKDSDDARVSEKAEYLLNLWSQLEMGYRIPRVKRDPEAEAGQKADAQRGSEARRLDRRDPGKERSRSRSRSRSVEAPKGPSGLRNGLPTRGGFGGLPRPMFRPPRPAFEPLPHGWFMAREGASGRPYYYSSDGQTTWQRPTIAATQPPPPPKEKTHEQKLQEIILSITQNPQSSNHTPTSSTPQPTDSAKEKTEKWRSYSEDKQMKIYENTLFPSVSYVMNKFKHKLPKDDLKRFAREVSKKLVSSDFKNGRIQDPTKINEKQEKNVKRYTREFLEKAVMKKIEHDKKKAARKAREGNTVGSPSEKADPVVKSEDAQKSDDDEPMADASDDEAAGLHLEPSPSARSGDKRRRSSSFQAEDSPSTKKFKADTPPPPPPPPPPADGNYFWHGFLGVVVCFGSVVCIVRRKQWELVAITGANGGNRIGSRGVICVAALLGDVAADLRRLGEALILQPFFGQSMVVILIGAPSDAVQNRMTWC
ncbi:hypothetical protein K490DRAFT_75642 [Saccharata proteae CBS 121410]|uniref:Histone-lysine N-methyltransferase, H3 lysine-36 specific n=1 Tax=Saccharata proteae CBS 121410 TaxID=1314787 RepID=A0A9P4HN30_9PEZI|nr:hypothetical protein K490DRAFT_75642 [Saccharata proteae CBS 121410]